MSWFNWEEMAKKASEIATTATEQAVAAAKVAADTSKTLATQVNEKVNQFVEEQKRDYNALEQETDLQNRQKSKKELMMESGVTPWWIDTTNTTNTDQLQLYDELKVNILKLCEDTNNFLIKAPSSASVFDFKLEYALPHANKALENDPVLPKIRFKMVPRRLTEEQFWKNYFYRVNVIRESLGVAKMEFGKPPIPTTPRNGTPKNDKNVSFPDKNANESFIEAANDKPEIEGNISDNNALVREKSQSVSRSKSEIIEPEQSEIKMDLSNRSEMSSEQITEMDGNDMSGVNEDEDFLADDIDVGHLSETEKAKMRKELGVEEDLDTDDIDVDNVDDILAEVDAEDIEDMSDGALEAELENI